jgi:hypothetical protein
MIITQWWICCEHIDTLIGALWEQIENIKIQKIQTTFCFFFLPPIPIPPSPNKKKLVLMLWCYDVQIIACHDLPLLFQFYMKVDHIDEIQYGWY